MLTVTLCREIDRGARRAEVTGHDFAQLIGNVEGALAALFPEEAARHLRATRGTVEREESAERC